MYDERGLKTSWPPRGVAGKNLRSNWDEWGCWRFILRGGRRIRINDLENLPQVVLWHADLDQLLA